jgi:hypothetical protein
MFSHLLGKAFFHPGLREAVPKDLENIGNAPLNSNPKEVFVSPHD